MRTPVKVLLEEKSAEGWAWQQVEKARKHQSTVHNTDRDMADWLWNLVLNEEVGEVARAQLDNDQANLDEELAQVAAVAIAWLTDRKLNRA